MDPKDWSSDDIILWIVSVAVESNYPYEEVNADNFNVDGRTLFGLSRNDFVERDPHFGGLLYDALHSKTHIIKST